MQDERARLACYDEAAGVGATSVDPRQTARAPEPERSAQPKPEAAGSPTTALPPAVDSRQTYGLPHRDDASSQITVEIAGTGLSPAGKLQFTTVDAMVWRQTAGDPAKAPRPGAKVVVSKGALGGHWCQLDRWTSIRCDRIK
jgi:hypothetical protein